MKDMSAFLYTLIGAVLRSFVILVKPPEERTDDDDDDDDDDT